MIRRILIVLFLVMSLFGCDKPAGSDSDKVKIVTTVYPVYDWVREIVGDSNKVEVKYLLSKGVDLHSYQPSSEDILSVSVSDLFIHVGGESDNWVSDVLKQATNKNMKVVNLIQLLGDNVKQESHIEGMEHHEHDHEDHEHENDEHVWLSLRNAKLFCEEISGQLSLLDPENAEKYKANCEAYCRKLVELDAQYQEAVSHSGKKTILVADRFPFRYLADDYGLQYYAAFSGCSAESEASFETVVFLANKVDELSLNSIIRTESSDGAIADTVKNATKNKDQSIIVLNSMQSLPEKDESYLQIMEENLKQLKQALK